jgi:hypothetical protein
VVKSDYFEKNSRPHPLKKPANAHRIKQLKASFLPI